MQQRAAQIGLIFHDFPLGGSERIAIRLMNRWAESGSSRLALQACRLRAASVRAIAAGSAKPYAVFLKSARSRFCSCPATTIGRCFPP